MKTREEELMESMASLDGLDLTAKKLAAIKESTKIQGQIKEMDLTKGSERLKVLKVTDKLSEQILLIQVADKLLKNKDF